MKLASLKEGGRDGTLIVVDRALTRAVRATNIATTLQKALDDWAAGSAESVLYRRGALLNGYRTADLHISRPDGRLVHWQVTLQNTIEGTRPDVLFKRVDAAPLTVAVYLDGYAYHAAADKNRLASDADQRARLRAEGAVVFQLNWDDVNTAKVEHPFVDRRDPGAVVTTAVAPELKQT